MTNERSANEPFQEIWALHKRLDDELVALKPVPVGQIAEFLDAGVRIVPRINSDKERDEVRYLMRFWGSYLAAQGVPIPELEIDVPLQIGRSAVRSAIHAPPLGQAARQAVSIHIGVDDPRGIHLRLLQSTTNAWRMAELADQAGYDAVIVLRGATATRMAVHKTLVEASTSLKAGDYLIVSFAGLGWQELDIASDTGDWEAGWCLSDGVLMEDELTDCWRLFRPGVRIILIIESCYSVGSRRDDRPYVPNAPSPVKSRDVWFDHSADERFGVANYIGSCIPSPPSGSDGINASMLLLTASQEDQVASEGLFSGALLEVWSGGAFGGSFCDLYREVRDRVLARNVNQEPRILMRGAPDPTFPLEPAFHLNRVRVRG